MPGTDSKGAVLPRALAATTATLILGLFGSGAMASDNGGIGTSDPDEPQGTGPAPKASKGGKFPVRARRVQWGDGMGAGRGHQGQDLITKCGKPVVAAQPGRVKLVKRHSAAGNYVVIDGQGKRKDAVYMHLQRRASVRKGQRVEAGQRIGLVGRTGRATTCHLHFELWDGKGWYAGGKPVNPRPPLKKWRRVEIAAKRNR